MSSRSHTDVSFTGLAGHHICTTTVDGRSDRRPDAVLTGSHDAWWTTVLGAKDAGLAIDLARAADVDLPATRLVQQLYERAASSGFRDADIAAVTELYRRPATAVSG